MTDETIGGATKGPATGQEGRTAGGGRGARAAAWVAACVLFVVANSVD